MFTVITEKIVRGMENREIIQADRRSIYKYGINQMFNMALNLCTFLVIGLIFRMLPETIVFTAAYIPFRIYVGGFHSKTPVGCWIISALIVTIVLALMKYVEVNQYVYGVLVFSATTAILLMFPVEDKNKPLDKKEIQVYKVSGILVFCIEIITDLTLKYLGFHTLSVCIEMVWMTLSIMLVTGKIKNFLLDHKAKRASLNKIAS
jgi:accessory gene regulator B